MTSQTKFFSSRIFLQLFLHTRAHKPNEESGTLELEAGTTALETIIPLREKKETGNSEMGSEE